jgi:hypothetical protein
VLPKVSKVAKAKAAQLCKEGLTHYRNWDVERAVEIFKAASVLDSTNADAFLYLAQAYMRLGDYKAMRSALGRFIHLETDETLIDRFEIFFGSQMDQVETLLTQVMTRQEIPLEVVGAAIHMWLEFRLAMGRKSINMAGLKPQVWAGALDYTIRKINFVEVNFEKIAEWYDVSPEAINHHHQILIEVLDIMPCDYRYFRGQENPLDRLIEAAMILEELEERFYKT